MMEIFQRKFPPQPMSSRIGLFFQKVYRRTGEYLTDHPIQMIAFGIGTSFFLTYRVNRWYFGDKKQKLYQPRTQIQPLIPSEMITEAMIDEWIKNGEEIDEIRMNNLVEDRLASDWYVKRNRNGSKEMYEFLHQKLN